MLVKVVNISLISDLIASWRQGSISVAFFPMVNWWTRVELTYDWVDDGVCDGRLRVWVPACSSLLLIKTVKDNIACLILVLLQVVLEYHWESKLFAVDLIHDF